MKGPRESLLRRGGEVVAVGFRVRWSLSYSPSFPLEIFPRVLYERVSFSYVYTPTESLTRHFREETLRRMNVRIMTMTRKRRRATSSWWGRNPRTPCANLVHRRSTSWDFTRRPLSGCDCPSLLTYQRKSSATKIIFNLRMNFLLGSYLLNFVWFPEIMVVTWVRKLLLSRWDHVNTYEQDETRGDKESIPGRMIIFVCLFCIVFLTFFLWIMTEVRLKWMFRVRGSVGPK